MSESPEERMANNKLYSVDAFAAGIKAKHPQYKDIDNEELVSKMLDKYPQYRESVDYRPAGGWSTPAPETPKKKDSTESPVTTGGEPTDLASQPQMGSADSLGQQAASEAKKLESVESESVSFFTSISNSATNIGKQLSLLDDKLSVVTDAVYTGILGKEMADSWYEWGEKNLWGENQNRQVIAKTVGNSHGFSCGGHTLPCGKKTKK